MVTKLVQNADTITMLEIEVFKSEFDQSRRVLHLSAERPIHVQNRRQLNKACEDVCEILARHTTDSRCYLLVDMSKVVIEPEMAEEYSRKIKGISEQYLLPNGLLRYGLQITRVTAMLAHKRQSMDDPLFFRSKDEAVEYIDNELKNSAANIT